MSQILISSVLTNMTSSSSFVSSSLVWFLVAITLVVVVSISMLWPGWQGALSAIEPISMLLLPSQLSPLFCKALVLMFLLALIVQILLLHSSLCKGMLRTTNFQMCEVLLMHPA